MQLQPIHLSSGNLIADRRFEWARDCEAKGDLAGAADLLTQALELAPGYASAWFVLGELREKARRPRRRHCGFRAGEGSRPAGSSRRRAPSHAAWRRTDGRHAGRLRARAVRRLRAGFRSRRLTEGLSYRAPELLFRAVAGCACRSRMKFGSVLDLGCGTGLAALAVPAVQRLDGRRRSFVRRCWRRRAPKVSTTG